MHDPADETQYGDQAGADEGNNHRIFDQRLPPLTATAARAYVNHEASPVEAFDLLEVQQAGRDKICIHPAVIVPYGIERGTSGQPITLECFGGMLILKAARRRMCKVPFLAPTARAETALSLQCVAYGASSGGSGSSPVTLKYPPHKGVMATVLVVDGEGPVRELPSRMPRHLPAVRPRRSSH
jgi:hypothetical protein